MRREQHGIEDSWHADLGWVVGYRYAMLDREWTAAQTVRQPIGLRDAPRGVPDNQACAASRLLVGGTTQKKLLADEGRRVPALGILLQAAGRSDFLSGSEAAATLSPATTTLKP